MEENAGAVQGEQGIDFYTYMKENVPFDNDMLEAEIDSLCSFAAEDADKPEAVKAAWLKVELNDSEKRAKAKKAITEVALLFSGALELSDDADYEAFAKKILLQSENEDAAANYVRSSLLLEDPSEPRQELAKLLVDRHTDQEGKLDKLRLMKAKTKFDSRVDMFIDAFRKQAKA